MVTPSIKATATLLALLLAVTPSLALAQEDGEPQAADAQVAPEPVRPTANAEAEAKAAYARGGDAFKLGHYPEAIQAFEDAYRLSHKVEILFNIGLANRKAYGIENKPEYLRRALDIYKQFLRLAQDDNERRAARQNITEISGQLAGIEESERVQRMRGGSGPLAVALKLYGEGRANDALAQIEAVLHHGGNQAVVLQDIYRLEGEIAVDAGQPALSIEAYKKLLALTPSFDLPKSASAGARENLGAARHFWTEKGQFSVSPVVPPPAQPDAPLIIPVLVENDAESLVARITVRYRRSGERRYSSVSRVGAGDVSIPAMALPPEDPGYRMEYFILATDAYNNIVTTIGGDTAPLSFPVLSPEEFKKLNQRGAPWYGSWWFVTTLTLVAIGAGLGIAAGAGAFTPGPPASSFPPPYPTLNADRPAVGH